MITKFIKSMGYALKGICLGIKEERNMRIDTVAMLFVWSILPFYNFTKGETALVDSSPMMWSPPMFSE